MSFTNTAGEMLGAKLQVESNVIEDNPLGSPLHARRCIARRAIPIFVGSYLGRGRLMSVLFAIPGVADAMIRYFLSRIVGSRTVARKARRSARKTLGKERRNRARLRLRCSHAVPTGLAVVGIAVVAGCALPQSGKLAAGSDGSGSKQNFMSLARDAERSGDLAAAATFYRKAAESRDDSVQAEIALGGTLYRANKYEQAESAYRSAVKKAPKTADAHFGLGKTLIALDRPQAAIDAFKAGQQFSEAKSVTGYIGQGVALDLLGRHGEAQRVYQKGLDRAPDNIKLLNNYGLSLILSGNLQTAVSVLKPLAEDDNANERIRQNLALAYGLQGDLQKAAEISNYDLSPAAVEENLKYYELAQQFVKQTGAPRNIETDAAKASKNYWAQIGAYKARGRAQKSVRALQEKYPKILGDHSINVQAENVDGKGTFHRIRVGPFRATKRPEALCAKLKAMGEACVVTPSELVS